MSKYGTYTFSFFVFALVNLFFPFPFPKFESVQTIKLIVSSKIAFAVLCLTTLYYFAFFSAVFQLQQLSHETYIDYQTTQTGSRTTVTFTVELFKNILDNFHFLIIITKTSILDGDRHFHSA